MRVAALVKQVPVLEELELGSDGRLRREGLELEMNPYCRRAVAQAVELATGGDGPHVCTFVSLGPSAAEDVLREAVAWALERGVAANGVLVSDPAFAGSDTLATARALAAAVVRLGPFDVVLVGRNSIDADTGQVGPQLAQLLGLPFLTGVRRMGLVDGVVHAECEHDDGWVVAEVRLPVLVSVAERLIDPCKVPPRERAAVDAERIRTLCAADLGGGPWGYDASPTRVGEVRVVASRREPVVLEGSVVAQVRRAVEILADRGAFDGAAAGPVGSVAPPRGVVGDGVVVLVEPGRPREARELLGAAAELASEISGHVVAMTTGGADDLGLGPWGADVVVTIDDADLEEDVANGVAHWLAGHPAWAVLAASTAWGREVASRVAAMIGAGLTGDAVELDVRDGRLVAWKPAFGGQLVAAIHVTSPTQMATVRAGVLPVRAPRRHAEPAAGSVVVPSVSRVRILSRERDDDVSVLGDATAVVGVGRGVDPSAYPELDPLLRALGAELGATRKVTDAGWLPHARQIGVTGRSIAPRLFVSIGASGKFNHMVGVRSAGTVLAINRDRDAPVFAAADVGIVADWETAVPALVDAIEANKEAQSAENPRDDGSWRDRPR